MGDTIDRYQVAELLGISYAKLTNLLANRSDLKFPQLPGRIMRKCMYDKAEVLKWAENNDISDVKWVNNNKSTTHNVVFNNIRRTIDAKCNVKFLSGGFDTERRKCIYQEKKLRAAARPRKTNFVRLKEINA